MERVELCCGGKRRGEITLQPQGQRMEIRAAMEDPGDGLYRLTLVGQRGELPLGVLEPAAGQLRLCRRIWCRDTEAVGRILRGEACCSFRFSENWQESCNPGRLLRDSFLRERLEKAERVWWRREGERLLLAIPLPEGEPFPLETLFCFAHIRQVAGVVCAVYGFDREERPVFL